MKYLSILLLAVSLYAQQPQQQPLAVKTFTPSGPEAQKYVDHLEVVRQQMLRLRDQYQMLNVEYNNRCQEVLTYYRLPKGSYCDSATGEIKTLETLPVKQEPKAEPKSEQKAPNGTK